MPTDTPKQSDVSTQLLDILERQKALMRSSQFDQYDIQSDRLDKLIDSLSESGKLATMPDQQRQKILSSFHELNMIVASHKQMAASQLAQVRQGKRTISAYQEI